MQLSLPRPAATRRPRAARVASHLPAAPGVALLLLALTLPLTACEPAPPPAGKSVAAGAGTRAARPDIHSYGRPDRVRVTHAEIDWTVDFDAEQIRGSVIWTLQRAPEAAHEPLVLDTKDLIIDEVLSAGGEAVEWEIGEADPVLGSPLTIDAGIDDASVRIDYRTGPGASALQWLTPLQTAGGAKPFLFSQAQAILARTMLPCQDSPGVRVTFDAQVTTPDGITALMAAERVGGGNGQPWRFRMAQPIPSYLIAIAAGEIAFQPMGPRTGVFAEPSAVEKAAWEFADTEKMIDAVERRFGPYRWERYDLIVLPPSFPYGGMENPRLSFVTPTIIAGDRSLTALVAHELAHSWSGNLVTNATWADFWMNEGFTLYLERRILEEVYGRGRSEMEALLGRQDLEVSLATLEAGHTALHNTLLEGKDPDEGSSDVPYEKGYLFLRLLEESFGRERFDPFLRKWFDDNAFQSRTTADFEAALDRDLFAGDAERKASLRVGEWLYAPGLPDNAPMAVSDAFDRAEAEADAFAAGTKAAGAIPAKAWTTHEWLHFLRSLPEDLPAGRMAELDAAFSLTQSGNSEILMRWLLQAIRSDYAAAWPALDEFLMRQGRRKFLEPLYTEMAKSESGKARALHIYAKARPTYHPISASTIDGVLGWKTDAAGH